MKSDGFEINRGEDGVVIDFVMPERLKDIFFARLYGKSALNDAADGDPEEVWNKLSARCGKAPLVAPRQIHGSFVAFASRENSLPKRPEADAVFISEKSDALASLRFADCAPLVLAGASEEPWLIVAHSGFAGTVENIARSSVEYALEKYPGQKKEDIYAWIGPSVCFECYSRRRSDKATQRALQIFSKKNIKETGDFVFFDVKGQICDSLSDTGVNRDKIYTSRACTKCEPSLFYSYRGGDEKKRMFLLAGAAKRTAKA